MGIRNWILAALALGMLVVCILTWGSLGSMALVFCLIMMAASLAYQYFLTLRNEDTFQSED